MINVLEFKGFPVPDESFRGNQEALSQKLGIKYTVPGWYETGEGEAARITLVVPPTMEMTELTADTVYVCYTWSGDPRQALALLVELPNQTPVPVPEEIRRAWPDLQNAAVELKAWGEEQMALAASETRVEEEPDEDDDDDVGEEMANEAETEAMAEQDGLADEAVRISLLPDEPPPAVPADDHLQNRQGDYAFRFGPFIVQAISAERRELLLGGPGLPPHSRLVQTDDGNSVAITLGVQA